MPAQDNQTLRDTFAEQSWSPPSGELTGTRIGRFSVLHKLGEGGMGVVYAAYDAELDRRVALKVLRTDLGHRPHIRDRLLLEAQMLAKLSHPNVVHVYDVGGFRQQIYLALEFVEGSTLRTWQNQRRGDWRAIVAMYRRCGEGLSAAHAAGLIHRDFKPENVLVGPEERPRVLDFGLAGLSSSSSDDTHQEVTGSSHVLGRRIGTPAYMSPEQHAGRATDARSDQFNFCAALFEALYEQRPFPGKNVDEIGHSILLGACVPPSRGPRWLRRLLLRGLAVEPERRWPSMRALLDEIDRHLSPRTVLWTIYIMSVALVGGFLLAFRSDPTPCDGGTRRVVDLWSSERLAAIGAAFEDTRVPGAVDVWHAAREQLDRYVREWHASYQRTCAAHLREELSDGVFDAQMACFDRRMLAVEAVLGVFQSPTENVVERARTGVAELRPIESCARLDMVPSVEPLPANPAMAVEVAALQARLERTDAMKQVGHEALGPEAARALLARARATAHAPLIASTLAHFALDYARNTGESERLLLEAVLLAEGSGDDPLVAELGLKLIQVMGFRNLKFDEASRWAGLVEAKLKRIRAVDPLWAELEHQRGTIARRRGDLRAASRHFETALQILRREQGQHAFGIGVNLRYLAATKLQQGEYAAVEGLLGEAEWALRSAVGERSRHFGLIQLTRGNLLLARNEFAAARQAFARLRDLWSRVVGPNSGEVALASVNLADACIELGEHAEAQANLERSAALVHELYGDRHPAAASVLMVRARLARDSLRPDAAEALYKRALSVYAAVHGSEHPDMIAAHLRLGELALGRDDVAVAEHHFHASGQLVARLLGEEHPWQAEVMLGLAEVALARHSWHEALDLAERAAVWLDLGAMRPAEQARVRFAVACAREATGAAADAVDRLAAAALAELDPISPYHLQLGARISRWRAEHGPAALRPTTVILAPPRPSSNLPSGVSPSSP